MVISKSLISFAFVGETAQIDHIPLADVVHIKEMAEAASEDQDRKGKENFSHVLQIATREDGHNSGRIYYLATESKESLDDLMSFLTKKSRKARSLAEAKTLYRRIQVKVRKYYESGQFQAIMAILIAAVSSS